MSENETAKEQNGGGGLFGTTPAAPPAPAEARAMLLETLARRARDALGGIERAELHDFETHGVVHAATAGAGAAGRVLARCDRVADAARLVEMIGICRALVAAMLPREKDEVR
jgi:hypothetical protein